MRIRNIWNGHEFEALASEAGAFSLRSGDPFHVGGFEVVQATQGELDQLPGEWLEVVTVEVWKALRAQPVVVTDRNRWGCGRAH